MRFSSIARAAATVAIIAAPAVAQAQITTYTTLSAFLAATTSQGTDDYQSLSITTTTPTPMNRTAGAYSYTVAAPGDFFGAGSAANHWLSTNTATSTMTFSNFGSNVRGIAGNFFGSDINGSFRANTSLIITLNTAAGSLTQTLTNATLSTFLGFTTTSNILSMTVQAVQPQQGFAWSTVDNFTLAQAAPTNVVPEPSTYLLMATGMAGLVGVVRRRRAATV